MTVIEIEGKTYESVDAWIADQPEQPTLMRWMHSRGWLTAAEVEHGWTVEMAPHHHMAVINRDGEVERIYSWPPQAAEQAGEGWCFADCPAGCVGCEGKPSITLIGSPTAKDVLTEDEIAAGWSIRRHNANRITVYNQHGLIVRAHMRSDGTGWTADQPLSGEIWAAPPKDQPRERPLSYCNFCGRWFEYGVVLGKCLNCQPHVDRAFNGPPPTTPPTTFVPPPDAPTGFAWGQGWCQPDCPAGCVKCQREAAGMKIADQPPQPNDNPAIWDLVIADMRERDQIGRERYGTPLQAGNGRDALTDAYQEALDLVAYLRQEIEERRARATTEGPA